MSRSIVIPLAVIILIYLGIIIVIYMKQEDMIYHPTREIETTPAEHGIAYEDVVLTASDATRLHGWWIPSSGSRGTLLYCHGNGGNISHRIESLRIFRGLGLDIFIFDYRGYGRSEGTPDEQGTYRDGEAAWRYLTEQRKIDPSRIIHFGSSLGGAISSYLAEHHGGAGLILESTFSSVPDLGEDLFPWLPVRSIVTYDYNTAARLPQIAMPVMIIHGCDDEMIPYSHGRRLYEIAGEPKQFLDIQGGHNDGFVRTGEAYIEGLEGFVDTIRGEG